MIFDSKITTNSDSTELLTEIKKSYKTYLVVVGFIYLLLVLSGIHTSSIGILGGERISDSTTYYGRPQPIRSDEYLRSTPILLGQIKSNERSSALKKRTITTPFDASYPDTLLSGDVENSQSSKLNFHSVYSGFLQLDDRVLSLLPLQN